MENLQALNLNNLDKTHWRTYRFDEIAKSISERIDPNNTDLEVYVGLEHIDPESIHLKRSGTPDDVDGQKLRFYPGDVIFGRRRAYQRKAAIATTHGFCSAHALVLRANPDVIDPKLFPFFIHSDAFMHTAVDISVGSLSPTINWGTLKSQEYRLPPNDQQKMLVDLFLNADNLIEAQKSYLIKLKKFYVSTATTLLNGYDLTNYNKQIPEGWIVKKIKELGTLSTSSVDKKKKLDESEVSLINYMDVYSSVDKKVISSLDFMKVTASEHQLTKNQVYKGDVLFTPSSETSDDIGHSCVIYEDIPEALFSYHLVRLNFDLDMNLDFKRFVFNNPKVLYDFTKKSKGATRMTLGLGDFNETEILIPPLNKQIDISKKLSSIIDSRLIIEKEIALLIEIQKKLINQIF